MADGFPAVKEDEVVSSCSIEGAALPSELPESLRLLLPQPNWHFSHRYLNCSGFLR